jgi:uncharacterized membrane protein YdfJ with MMPL/SSD domain
MYLEDGREEPTPLTIDDHRLMDIIECAIRLREDQNAADGWRKIQTVEKAKQMQSLIQKDRDKVTAEEEAELEEMIRDSVASYSRKLRHAYLS